MHLSFLLQQPPLCLSLSHPCKLEALSGTPALASDFPAVVLSCCLSTLVLQAQLQPTSSNLAVQDLPDSEPLPLQGRGAEARTGIQDDHPAKVPEGHARGAARRIFPDWREGSPPGDDQEIAGAGVAGKKCTDDRELLPQDIQKGRPCLNSGSCTSANDGARVICLCGCSRKLIKAGGGGCCSS